jgi:hypothetical protein
MKSEILWQIIERHMADSACRQVNHYSIQFNQIKLNRIESNRIEWKIHNNRSITYDRLWEISDISVNCFGMMFLKSMLYEVSNKVHSELIIEWRRRTNSARLPCVIRNPFGTRAYQHHTRIPRPENRKQRLSISADGSNIAQFWITVWIVRTWWDGQFARRAATDRPGQWHATVHHSGIRTRHRFAKTLTKPVLLHQGR